MGIELSTLSPSFEPVLYTDLQNTRGCLCEIRNPESNLLIFLGRVRSADEDSITVVPAGGREAPPTIYKAEYKLVLRIPGQQTLVWRGVVAGSSRSFWKFADLVQYHHQEQRGAFRQPVQKQARVLCINRLYPGAPMDQEVYYARLCRVLDISLGGLLLQSEDLYASGDHLAVMDLWLDEGLRRPFLFTVQVRWSSRVPNQRFCRCGCAFEAMTLREEDRLCATILNLQRKDIAKRA